MNVPVAKVQGIQLCRLDSAGWYPAGHSHSLYRA